MADNVVRFPQPGDLGEGDRNKITAGWCPTCDRQGFRLGPQAGIAINIECVNCRARFNVAMYGGNCIMAQKLARESEGGPTWPGGHQGTFS